MSADGRGTIQFSAHVRRTIILVGQDGSRAYAVKPGVGGHPLHTDCFFVDP
jgi:hypothetical protein